MKSTVFLRIASIMTLLNFAGHTLGMPWTPAVGPDELPILEAMKTHSFDVLGSTRTYWDFFFGFGIIISVYLLMQGLALWQIGSMVKTDAARVRPLIGSFLLAFALNAALAWKYFFIIPFVMNVVSFICLAIAFALAGGTRPASRNAGSDL